MAIGDAKANEPQIDPVVDAFLADVEQAIADGRAGFTERYATEQELSQLFSDVASIAEQVAVDDDYSVLTATSSRAKVLDAMVYVSRIVRRTVYSRYRWAFLQQTYLNDDPSVYRLYLLDSLARLRFERIEGNSSLPILERVVEQVEYSGTLDGLHSVIVQSFDALSRETGWSSLQSDVQALISRIAVATGASSTSFVASGPTPQSVIAGFPFAVPLGRSNTDIVVEVRPDLLVRMTEVYLDSIDSGQLPMPGSGLEELIGTMSQNDCLDLPSFIGAQEDSADDSSQEMGGREATLGICGGGGGGAGGSLGMFMGFGIANSCLNDFATLAPKQAFARPLHAGELAEI